MVRESEGGAHLHKAHISTGTHTTGTHLHHGGLDSSNGSDDAQGAIILATIIHRVIM